MLRTTLFLLFLLLTLNLFSQFYIKGKVSDSETQQPLKDASVYINNSTKGTTTDANGEFQLGPFEPGQYEIVASYVGYDALLYSAELKTTNYRISFRLDKKGTLLSEVLVLTKELRNQYLEILKQNILGFSTTAGHCRIRNLDEVQFVSGKTKDEIIAYTEKELVIDNPDLGYIVYFELVDFYYNKFISSTYFFGYTRYVDLATDEQSRKKFLRKRRHVYEGSTMHFFRSLLKKRLDEEGFTVYQLTTSQQKKDSLGAGDSKKEIPQRRTYILTADSMTRLYSDSVYRIYELRIGDGWRISYRNNTDLKLQMDRKSLAGFQPQNGMLCGLRLRQAPVLLNEKGTLLTPVRIYYDGIWAFERLANMLPEDYENDK